MHPFPSNLDLLAVAPVIAVSNLAHLRSSCPKCDFVEAESMSGRGAESRCVGFTASGGAALAASDFERR